MALDPAIKEGAPVGYDDRPIHSEPGALPPEVQAPLAPFQGQEPDAPKWFTDALAQEPERGFVTSLGTQIEPHLVDLPLLGSRMMSAHAVIMGIGFISAALAVLVVMMLRRDFEHRVVPDEAPVVEPEAIEPGLEPAPIEPKEKAAYRADPRPAAEPKKVNPLVALREVIADRSLRLSTRVRIVNLRQRQDGHWDVGGEFF